MIVMSLQPIFEKVPPYALEGLCTLASKHEGQVIGRCLLKPHVAVTYACLVCNCCIQLQL